MRDRIGHSRGRGFTPAERSADSGVVVVAAALATVLMSTPAASAIGDVVHVFDPVAYVASLLVMVTACVLASSVPAWRAARIDPSVTLRRD